MFATSGEGIAKFHGRQWHWQDDAGHTCPQSFIQAEAAAAEGVLRGHVHEPPSQLQAVGGREHTWSAEMLTANIISEGRFHGMLPLCAIATYHPAARPGPNNRATCLYTGLDRIWTCQMTSLFILLAEGQRLRARVSAPCSTGLGKLSRSLLSLSCLQLACMRYGSLNPPARRPTSPRFAPCLLACLG